MREFNWPIFEDVVGYLGSHLCCDLFVLQGGSSQSSPVSTNALTYLIEQCGSNLKELFLASNYLLSPHVPLADLYVSISLLVC